MLLPDADILAEAHQLTRLRLFEGRAEIAHLALRGDDGAVQALGQLQRDAGKIVQAGGGIEIERLQSLLAHEALGLLDALLQFGKRDWLRPVEHRRHARQFRCEGRAAYTDSHPITHALMILSCTKASPTSSRPSAAQCAMRAEVPVPQSAVMQPRRAAGGWRAPRGPPFRPWRAARPEAVGAVPGHVRSCRWPGLRRA